MLNDKDIHKKTVTILASLVALMATVGTLINYFPATMAIIALTASGILILGAIYVCVYLAVQETRRG